MASAYLRDTQALQPLFGELDEGLRPVTDQGAHGGSQRFQPLVHEGLPGRIAAIFHHFFQQDIPRGEVQKDQPQVFQEGCVHGTNDLWDLSTRCRVLLPGVPHRHNRLRQRLHHAS